MRGWGGLPHRGDLGWSQAVGLVDEVAEHALQGQGFGGERADGCAEKRKLGKQKPEIAWRERRRRTGAASCHGFDLGWSAIKRSPDPNSVRWEHDILTDRPFMPVAVWCQQCEPTLARISRGVGGAMAAVMRRTWRGALSGPWNRDQPKHTTCRG